MGHWMDLVEFDKTIQGRFAGCMAGRTMFVIPFSMGPVGGPLSKIGVQVRKIKEGLPNSKQLFVRLFLHVFWLFKNFKKHKGK